MSDQSGREARVDGNPNPHGTCFCGKAAADCPGGTGYVSPNEIEGEPYYEVANYISDACVLRLARGVGNETNGVGASEGAVQARHTGPESVLNPDTGSYEWVAPWPPNQRPSWYTPPVDLSHFQDADPLVTQLPPVAPPRHENPSADSLEEATRLLEEQDIARLEDNGGPVI